MTSPLPPDPDGLNNERTKWAAAALRSFRRETGADDEALSDLLCDLMHWCDRNESAFDDALSTARTHYTAETAPDPTEENQP